MGQRADVVDQCRQRVVRVHPRRLRLAFNRLIGKDLCSETHSWTFLRHGTASFREKTKSPGLATTEAGHGTGRSADVQSGKRGIEMCGYSHFYIEITMIESGGQAEIALSL
jgi:hypothetical protein